MRGNGPPRIGDQARLVGRFLGRQAAIAARGNRRGVQLIATVAANALTDLGNQLDAAMVHETEHGPEDGEPKS